MSRFAFARAGSPFAARMLFEWQLQLGARAQDLDPDVDTYVVTLSIAASPVFWIDISAFMKCYCFCI